MVRREMGRHWSTEEGRQVSTLRSSEGQQKEVSKMRATCKSHTDDKGQKASAVRRKRAVSNKGPKPTNVKTFAKDGGMIKQAQRKFRKLYFWRFRWCECW